MENQKNTPPKKTMSDKQKARRRRRIRAISKTINTFSYIIMILAVSLIVSTFGMLVANDMFALIKPEQTVVVTFDGEKTVGEMADLLTENEIIEFGWAFNLYASLQGIETFEGGTFDIEGTMDYGQIINTFLYDYEPLEVVTITFVEGWTMQQYAQALEENGVCTQQEFFDTAANYDFAHEMLQDVPMIENRLEGYLFPDTYDFYKNENPVSVINKMLNNFVRRFTTEMQNLTIESERTIAEIVNVASLIEKEAYLPGERTTISGVIYNRLNNSSDFPYLNIDASILYVTGHKEALTAEDLQIDSPYNTYTETGLPPTAICNPGLGAMLAAILPEDHGYYYYVADPEDGSHVFSKTLSAHNNAVEDMREKAERLAAEQDD